MYMKLYLVYGDGVRVFYQTDEVANFLTNQKLNRKNINQFTITEIEADIKSESCGEDYLSFYQSAIARESSLDICLGDEYAEGVQKLKSIIEQSVKSSPQQIAFLTKLKITPPIKKNISKLLSFHVNFILYEVPICLEDSVDYYRLVLSLHGFRKIEEKFVREIYNTNGYLHSRSYCTTPKRIIEGFQLAKSK